MLKILILLLLITNGNSMAKYKEPYGENTEGWYLLLGYGLSLTNNHGICEFYPDECVDQDKFEKRATDVFFYKHINKNSLIGIGISNKDDRYIFEDDIVHTSHEHYLLSLSIINYLKTFGKGPFLRLDIGSAMNEISYFNDYEEFILSEEVNKGRGILFGTGYSLDFEETRLLLGLYYTTTIIDNEVDNYLNFVIGGLF